MSIAITKRSDRIASSSHASVRPRGQAHAIFDVENPPNAAILMDSLRHVGYSNKSAVEDLIDNSIDARAARIAINVNHTEADAFPELDITDDGSGMSLTILDEALKLGSQTGHDLRSDLGKFGMGLVTAGHSIARRIHILTKEAGKPLYVSISDVDEMIRQKSFIKALYEGASEDLLLFKKYLANAGFDLDGDNELHGTVILLLNCDGWTGINRTTKRFTTERIDSEANYLIEYLGSTFRRFLEAGLQISINNHAIEPVDEFMVNDGGIIYLDEDLDFEVLGLDGKPTQEVARVKVGCIPEAIESGVATRQKPSLRNQGFSILRNHREIASGLNLDVFVKHNDLNRLRGEIEFPAALDDLLGVHFTKQGIEPSQAFLDKLRQMTFRVIQQIRRETKKAAKLGEEDAKLHREAEKDIAEKQHLLLLPPGANREKRTAPKPSVDQRNSDDSALEKIALGKRDRRKFRKSQPGTFRSTRFEAANFGEYGPIYCVDKEGGTVVITWNIEHPFYETFVLGNNPRGSKAIDYFVYSLACTELMVDDEQTLEFVENMRAMVAANMRTLLR